MRVPGSTYRLQVNAEFKLSRVLELVDYFDRLGITDLYLSPILEARPGSTHGYDVTDPARINHEVGTEEELVKLGGELSARGMSILLDIVPNHMCAAEENPWWRDVLEHGPSSPYARFFDIDWLADSTGGFRVMLPMLGQAPDECIASNELRLVLDEEFPTIGYFDRRLPIDPATYPLIFKGLAGLPQELIDIETAAAAIPPREDVSRAAERRAMIEGIRIAFAEARARLEPEFLQEAAQRIREVLDAQTYTLSHWLPGGDLVNYRRFFDITDLAGLRSDRLEVFEATHQRIMPWLADGTLGGVRVDHIDGLRDPQTYLERLKPHYVVVEKILIGDEPLPESWATAGTSGYDFLGILNGLFVDPDGWEKLGRAYARLIEPTDFEELAREKKRLVMETLFAGDVLTLTRRLATLTQLGFDECRAALSEVSANLPVYRTYRTEAMLPARDERLLRDTFDKARAHGAPALALDAFERILIAPEGDDQHELAMRWQQFTGPITAKGVEDTAFYNYHRLISVCEVGGDPGDALYSIARFHERMLDRAARWPNALNATSTHDTKRGEDTRARINVLSELAETWIAFVDRWIAFTVPDRMDALQIFQTLIGAWPLEGAVTNDFRERLRGFAEKAMREGKRESGWKSPDADYEKDIFEFIDRLFADQTFIAELREIEAATSWYGMLNGLSQVALKLGAPGVPDIYQGSELWNLSLVDPDNRRPVDYEMRDSLLEQVTLDSAMADWKQGSLKLLLTTRGLVLRRELAELFAHGDYRVVRVTGSHARNVIAFMRSHEGRRVLFIATRFLTEVAPLEQWPAPADWGNTRLKIDLHSWQDVLTERTVASVAIGELLGGLTVALLRD